MRTIILFLSLLILLYNCRNSTPSKKSSDQNNNLRIANEFIEAFYSFDKDSLLSILSHAEESRQSILYYQGWAECGNYEIIDRPDCIEKNDSVILCPVTVKDDLIGALQIDFNVTDTFHLTIINEQIRFIETSSNDPEQYYQAREWVKQNNPELIEEPCEGIWEDGDTPCECVRAMVKGYEEFIVNKKNTE